jgi:hypothetical protein
MNHNQTIIRLGYCLNLAVLLLGCSTPQLPSGAAAPAVFWDPAGTEFGIYEEPKR